MTIEEMVLEEPPSATTLIWGRIEISTAKAGVQVGMNATWFKEDDSVGPRPLLIFYTDAAGLNRTISLRSIYARGVLPTLITWQCSLDGNREAVVTLSAPFTADVSQGCACVTNHVIARSYEVTLGKRTYKRRFEALRCARCGAVRYAPETLRQNKLSIASSALEEELASAEVVQFASGTLGLRPVGETGLAILALSQLKGEEALAAWSGLLRHMVNQELEQKEEDLEQREEE